MNRDETLKYMVESGDYTAQEIATYADYAITAGNGYTTSANGIDAVLEDTKPDVIDNEWILSLST